MKCIAFHIFSYIFLVRNYKKAIELLQIAIDKNNHNYNAINLLGHMYYKGEGTEQNFEKAIELYLRSIVGDHSFAMNNLAYMYERGEGVGQDYPKAIGLYERSVRKNNYMAEFNLGRLYHHGLGVEQNYPKAIELYQKSVRENFKLGIDYLVILYRSIKPIYKKEAIKYFFSINQKEKIKEIYGYDDYVIKNLEKNIILKSEIKILREHNIRMKNHIEASPGGKLYLEAFGNFKSLL